MSGIVPAMALGLVVVGLIVALLRARRWVFFAWTVVRPAAWPALWGLLLIATLGLVDQGQALVQRALEGWRWLPHLASSLVAAFLMAYAGAALLVVRYPPLMADLGVIAEQLALRPDSYDRWCDRLRRAFPMLIFALPFLAHLPALIAWWLPAYREAGKLIVAAAALAVAAAAFAFASSGWFARRLPPRQRWLWPLLYPDLSDRGIEEAHEAAARRSRKARRQPPAGHPPLGDLLPGTRWAFATAFMTGVALFALAIGSPVRWAEQAGTAAIVVAAASSFAVTGALLAHVVNRHFSVSIPYALLLLLTAAGLFARWGLSDNHAVREIAGPAAIEEMERARGRPTFEEHLAAWLEARGDGAGKPQPLVVVAAQGGGIRAALWGALALGRLQERIPSFPCDLFAIASVSGGSLAAITYAAMLAESPPACGPGAAAPAAVSAAGLAYATAAESAFGRDLLAPVAAGLLFPDMLQRFLFLNLLPDRQLYLEQAWEQAWARSGAVSAGLGQPFLSLFPPARRPFLPALFLVASDVEGGRRWITSSVRVDPNLFADAIDTLPGRKLLDDRGTAGLEMKALPASAAAGLSARFPYVSPPGTLRFAHGAYHLLDGGIVESSGAATAAEILLALRSQCGEPEPGGILACAVRDIPGRPGRDVTPCGPGDRCIRVRPTVIQLTNAAWEAEGDRAARPSWAEALTPRFPELLDPFQALLASRTGRGRGAHDRLQGDRLLLAGETCLALDIVLNLEDMTEGDELVPLGWTLRRAHVANMRSAIGRRLGEQPLPPEAASRDFATWRANVYDRPAGVGCRPSLGSQTRPSGRSGLGTRPCRRPRAAPARRAPAPARRRPRGWRRDGRGRPGAGASRR